MVGDQHGTAIGPVQGLGGGLKLLDVDGFGDEGGYPARAMAVSHIARVSPLSDCLAAQRWRAKSSLGLEIMITPQESTSPPAHKIESSQ